MGQFFSWFLGPRDTPALRDVTVEQQVTLTRYKHWQISSQAKQPTSTPAVLVSTVKPAECEKGTASSSNAGSAGKAGSTTATTALTSTTATSTAGVSAGAKAGGGVSTGSSVSGAPPAGAVGSVGTQSGASKATSQTPPIPSAKAPSVSTGSGIGGTGTTGGAAGAGKSPSVPVLPKDASKDKAQSTTTSSSKPDPSKETSFGAGSTVKKDDAKSKGTKVEVLSQAAKASAQASAVDPFDALAGSLPSSEPTAPKAPKYTGPEVKEPGLSSEAAHLCGERDSTLPPGYRWEDMEKKSPAGKPDKPKEVPKPLTDEDALDSLSAGFVSCAAASAPKTQAQVAPPASKASALETAADPFDALAGSLPSAEFPIAPQYTGTEVIEPAITVEVAYRCGDNDCTLPPRDRWENMEKTAPVGGPDKPKDVSKKVESAATAQSIHAPPPSSQKRQEVFVPASVSPAAPADKKAKVEKPAKETVKAAPPSSHAEKPKDNEGDPMSLDALNALEDTLPAAKPPPESPKLRPEDIVDEKKLKSEKGVRVGERDDTLPPEYRFTEEKNKERPAPQKEPSMDTTEALDILSEGFTLSSAAPAVQAPVPPSGPAKQKPKVEDLSALESLADDFVTPAQSKQVSSGAPQVIKCTMGSTSAEEDPMSLDALSALGDTLPTAKVPESPKLRPEDIIDEKNLTSEKGVRVGERDDTLPPDYRFSKEDLKKYPESPKREPSMDTTEALDILSGGFASSSAAPSVQAPVPPSAPPAESSADFSLEDLESDFVAPTAASKVHSAVTGPPKTNRQMSEGTSSAMDALSDTLMDIGPVPEPAPVAPKDIVTEKEAVEEKITKPGERDDSLPPDYRPTEADKKAAAEAKAKAKADVPKKPSLDDSAAIDLLSSDFSTSAVASPAAPLAKPQSQTQSAPGNTQQTPKAPGPVLDKLASTLLPDLPETKPTKDSKAKKPAVDDVPAKSDLPGQQSKDVVSTSSTKKGGKS
ncbi:calpastatin isoform X5 [Hoplias malabaricus]|uniref:calpastatin isoform X5 n=1 Tax=Hoplias malabaricus TaxID=27720 RepID=UPI0034622A1B